MKILHLLSSSRFSGAENVACQIIAMLPELEMVYCSPDGPIREALAERGVVFAPLKTMSVGEVLRVIREEKPELIHAHDMRATFLAALCCGNIPMISHIHNNHFDAQTLTVKAVLYRLAAIRAKHIFWVSQAAQEGYLFHKALARKSSLLRNVIDGEQLRHKAARAENRRAYDIVYLGRLTHQKNPQRLLRVLEQVVRRCPQTQAAIIGTGELEEDVKQLVEEKNLQDNVHCLGFLDNPHGILQNAKAMVLTSRWEGLPICVLEAMALGVPIVSTPTDGVREVIIQGENGFLSDDDGCLTDSLVSLISDGEVRRKMGEAALASASVVLNLEAYKNTVLAVYSKWAKKERQA